MSDARLDISPRPPTAGNSSAATITLASRQDQASLMIVEAAGVRRSDMGDTLLRPTSTPAAAAAAGERDGKF